jgi:hypothetical protein
MSLFNSLGTYPQNFIVADFPGELPRAIARTYNKIDAEDSVRFLKRKTANGSFFIVFDPEPQKIANGA